MAENDTYTSIERTYCIDAGKDFIIPQYLNFFLCILEERAAGVVARYCAYRVCNEAF